MNDLFDDMPSRAANRGSSGVSGRSVRAQLEAARTAGAWMPWAGAALAFAGWAGVAAWIYVAIGFDVVLKQPPLVIAGGLGVFLVPGLALICAGIMARESRRAAEANALVLTSARTLLEPAETARHDIASIAEAVKAETTNVNKALTETRSKMDNLRHDIEQSVTSALKASEIVRTDSEILLQKMGSERQSMGQLAEALRNQAENLSKAIPRHAQMMSEATQKAQEEVRRAEETLDTRQRGLEDTARRLAERIDQLDTMGAESRKRAQNLAGALMRLDEQLVQSTRMVEAAMRAGELAAEASKGTASSLRDAMADTLDSALRISETINTRAAEAADMAQTAMSRLKDAGLQAEATTKAASMAARSQADETEKRINELSEFLFRAATKATQAAESGLERARARIERASLLLNQMRDDAADPPSTSVDDIVMEPPKPAPAPEVLRQPAARPGMRFDSSAVPLAEPTADFQSAMREAGATEKQIEDHLATLSRQSPVTLPSFAQPMAGQPAATVEHSKPGLSWRDLLTGIEEVPEKREESASVLMEQLERAGVRLAVVKASDLRRIATAAHQGERPRRRATRDIAPSEIQRVTRLLDADHDLQRAARTFVMSEEPDALRLLEGADRAREEASPRLSAYLLLDAALGTQI